MSVCRCFAWCTIPKVNFSACSCMKASAHSRHTQETRSFLPPATAAARAFAPPQRFGRAKVGPLPNILNVEAAAARGPMQGGRETKCKLPLAAQSLVYNLRPTRAEEYWGLHNGWSPDQPRALAGAQRDAHGRRRQTRAAYQVGFWDPQPLGNEPSQKARRNLEGNRKKVGQRRRRLTRTREINKGKSPKAKKKTRVIRNS